MRVRTSRVTGWPTASHIRRTWRLRPSWIVMRSTPGTGLGDAGRGRRSVVQLDALAQPADRSGTDRTAVRRDGGEVLLLDTVARVGEPVGQLAVVGQQQQPFGVDVEAPDREDPRLGGHELHHGPPALRISTPSTRRRRAC